MAYIQEVLVWSKPHEFSKDARELKSAHPHVSREHAQAMLIGEPCHQLLSRRLNPFRIRRELNVGKIPRGGLRWIQIRRDNQIDHPLVRSEVATLLRQSMQPPAKESEIVSYADT